MKFLLGSFGPTKKLVKETGIACHVINFKRGK
jgi:hypothetical protein